LIRHGLLRVARSRRRRRRRVIGLIVSLLRIRVRRLGVLRLLWIANLQVVVDLADAGHMRGDGFSQLPGAIRSNRAGECDFALDRGCGNQIVGEGLGTVQCMDDVHLNLSIGTLASWRSCSTGILALGHRQRTAQGNQSGTDDNLPGNLLQK
jgi:hypothetical protein